MVSSRNLTSSKLLCIPSLPAKIKMIQSKMNELKWSQHFPIISTCVFPDAQGQLTPQSVVRSSQISNSYETLWLSWLPAKMKRIRSKKALECSKHYTSIFQTLKGW